MLLCKTVVDAAGWLFVVIVVTVIWMATAVSSSQYCCKCPMMLAHGAVAIIHLTAVLHWCGCSQLIVACHCCHYLWSCYHCSCQHHLISLECAIHPICPAVIIANTCTISYSQGIGPTMTDLNHATQQLSMACCIIFVTHSLPLPLSLLLLLLLLLPPLLPADCFWFLSLSPCHWLAVAFAICTHGHHICLDCHYFIYGKIVAVWSLPWLACAEATLLPWVLLLPSIATGFPPVNNFSSSCQSPLTWLLRATISIWSHCNAVMLCPFHSCWYVAIMLWLLPTLSVLCCGCHCSMIACFCHCGCLWSCYHSIIIVNWHL